MSVNCINYILYNQGEVIVYFNYRKCDNSELIYQVDLYPQQTKRIWAVEGSLQYSQTYNNDLVVTIEGEPITPTPTLTMTPTPSATQGLTPTPTTTSTMTPTPSTTQGITPTPTPTTTSTMTPTPSTTQGVTPTPTPTSTSTTNIFAYLFPEPQDSDSQLALGQYMFDNGATSFYGFGNSGVPGTSSYSNDLSVYASFSGFTNGGGTNFKVPVSTLKSQIRQSSGIGTDTFGCSQQQYTFGTIQVTNSDINVSQTYFYTVWIPVESIPTSWSNMKVAISAEQCVGSPTIPSEILSNEIVTVGSGAAIPQGDYRILWMPLAGLIVPGFLTLPIYFKGDTLIL